MTAVSAGFIADDFKQLATFADLWPEVQKAEKETAAKMQVFLSLRRVGKKPITRKRVIHCKGWFTRTYRRLGQHKCRNRVKVYGLRCEKCEGMHRFSISDAKERMKRKPARKWSREELLSSVKLGSADARLTTPSGHSGVVKWLSDG